MINVGCPSCNTSYDVDEDRLPEGGLRMRCPKCSESFQVHRDGSTAKVGGGAAPAASTPPRAKRTKVGMGPAAPPPSPAALIRSQPSDLPAAADDIDLPAPFGGSDFADLPVPKTGSHALDLDPFADSGSADLPAPKHEASPSGFDPFADIDLPAVRDSAGGTDLPAPLHRSPSSDPDLPVLKRGGAGGSVGTFGDESDLPMALTDAELPTPRRGSDIPAPISLDTDLPMSGEQKDLPVARDDFMDLDIEGPERVHGGGPVELDLPEGDDIALEMELDAPPRPPAPPPPVGAPGAPPPVGRSAESEVQRDSAELELPESGDLDPSAFPSGSEGEVHRMPRLDGDGAAVDAAPSPRRKQLQLKRPPWLMKALAGLTVVTMIVGAGVYLGTTKYGLFGMHLLEPMLPASGDPALVAQAIEDAEIIAASDTYAAQREALAKLQAARGDASLNRSLVARTLLHRSYSLVRYGPDAESASLADALRVHLQRRGDEAPRIHVALAADALRNADIETAKSELALAAQDDATDPYLDLVAGETALKSRDGQSAVDAFGRAVQKSGSARAHWGLARGHQIMGNAEEAAAAAEATLKLSPNHAGARVAVAGLSIEEGQIERALELLQVPAGLAPVEGTTLRVSKADRSAALTLVARVDEQRGRLGAAREMYEKSIELDTSNTNAALGAARLVLLEGAYADAYARFQTVLGSQVPAGAELDATGQPKVSVQAKLGAAEALLAMSKAEEANELLADLRTDEPVNAEVELWQGKVAEGLGQGKVAVKHFRNAIKLEPKSIRAYMALAQHYTSTKRPGEAVGVLVEAQKNVDITAEVRRVLGWAELQRNRFDDAIKQFTEALEMEPRDSSAQFGLAVAYRRKWKLDEAEAELAKVEALDAKFPGLALERGRLAEARGDMDAATESYRKALVESPDDAALKSRMGAVLVLAGKLEEAEKLLREVLDAQPYSAEAEHYLGRIELERGQLEVARQRFLRAARLEAESGLYRMYVGWAALESNEMRTALRELDAALKLDPTLGDAYWLRARIRIRAGTVRDALADLKKAIELNPNRIQAWAAMGESHYQLGQMKEAIAALEKAVAGDPRQGYWWYRLGRLQLDEGQRAKALASLSEATSIGDEAPSGKAWVADSHRLTGDIYYAQKKRQEAIVEYGRYLELADREAIDRADVENRLRRISEGLN
ncbi:MAG: tetratricopeptide repeat protein [Myxococcales bacterium]|nr:tetratricopeptide repeat protein [Myxococcales bacterium]